MHFSNNPGCSIVSPPDFTSQWRNSSIFKESGGFSSVINHSEPAIISLHSPFSVCLSLSFLDTLWWSIITTACVSINIHHSLWSFTVRGSLQRNEKRREKAAFQSGAKRRLLSSLFPNDLPDRKNVSLPTHFRLPVLRYTRYLSLSYCESPADLCMLFE